MIRTTLLLLMTLVVAPALVTNGAVASPMTDLTTLISGIDTDTLTSFVEHLEGFDGRVMGTDSNHVARAWIEDKFDDYGYDSIYHDSFTVVIDDQDSTCYNIVATKTGTYYPDQQIIVGAHFDTKHAYPGANDNGSGVAGLLAIAKALSNVSTDMTVVLIAFDAEEYSYQGSKHYADSVITDTNDVVCMYNLDQIGNDGDAGSENQAALYYGPDRTYAELWSYMAESLLSFKGRLCSYTGHSDHQYFAELGIPVCFVLEYDISDDYHSASDVSTNMDFTYLTKVVKASLAAAYAAAMPQPALSFTYPYGRPDVINPVSPTSFRVQVDSSWDGEVTSGSQYLVYEIDGDALDSVALDHLGDGLYEATIPLVDDNDWVKYWVSMSDPTSGRFSDPDTIKAVVATEIEIVLDDDFETDEYWSASGTATSGTWERAVPSDGAAIFGAPSDDFDSSGIAYITDNEDYPNFVDVDGGTVTLTSPVIDLDSVKARVTYARWFSNVTRLDATSNDQERHNDVMRVIVDNGSTEAQADSVGPVDRADGLWYVHNFLVQDFVTPSATVQVKFEAEDGGTDSQVEAGLDAVLVMAYDNDGDALEITTTSLPDGTAQVAYSQQLETNNDTSTLVWQDKYGDLVGTGFALSTGGELFGSHDSVVTIGFVAQVVDDDLVPDERTFEIDIATCCDTRVGDANGLGGDEPTIGDVSVMIDAKFISGYCEGIINCLSEADVNQSGGDCPTCDDVTIGDISTLYDYLFITGPELGLNDCL